MKDLGDMDITRIALLLLLTACSSDPERDGAQPYAVDSDGGVAHAEQPEEVQDAIAELEARVDDPSACEYFAAAFLGYACAGWAGDSRFDPLLDLRVRRSHGCPATAEDMVVTIASCEELLTSEQAWCGSYAVTSHALVCCTEDSAAYHFTNGFSKECE